MIKHLAQIINIEGNGGAPPVTIEGPADFIFGSSNLGEIVGASLSYVFAAAGIGLLLMIISSGFTLMMSAGDAKKLASGRSRLTNSIVGFLLVFGAFWIVQIIGTILGWQESIGSIFQ